MKIAYYLIMASGLFLMNCSANAKSDDNTNLEVEGSVNLPANIEVKDPSLYGKKFLEDYEQYDGKILMDGKNIYIGDDTEPVILPDFLKQGTTYIFSGEENGEKVELKLTAINLTDLKYELKISGEKSISRSGIASIPGLFFLGSESFEIEDISVLAYEYRDYDDQNEDYTSFRITDEFISEGKLYGNLSFTLKGNPIAAVDDIILTSILK